MNSSATSAKNILVCGGGGYIGSHMCKALAHAGRVPVTFDNISTGHCSAVKWGPLIEGDLLDRQALAGALREFRIEAVMHFAARSPRRRIDAATGAVLPQQPRRHLNLLDAMREIGTDRLVFSSTAAVYGDGNSVAEVLAACRRYLEGKPASQMHPRREGDPPVLVADPGLARRSLGWSPRHSLAHCIGTAPAWYRRPC
jgi:UDP-glucose 4-epimerase